MPRRCGWCTHPNRRELEQRVLDGESIRLVSLDLPYSESAAHRHLRNHLGRDALREMRGSAALHVADFAERLAALAEETAAVRALAKNTGDGRLLLSAVQVERDTLAVLLNRLGIDGEETVEVLCEAKALAKAVGAVLSTRSPEVALAISTYLSDLGEGEMSESFRHLSERSRAAAGAPPSSVDAPVPAPTTKEISA